MGMSPLFEDTPREVEEEYIRRLREMPVSRKMQLLNELNEMALRLAMSGLRQRYPRASEEELRRRLADLLLGPDLAKEVYGPLVEEATCKEMDR